ncbi:hypothetical protein [Nitrosophilus kaiyonis]|uniref:hypothetical protein n=1 Tax=Nitrosophilus kaiyonis TaxID=2930200 RepID=UPI0024931ABB|nr:hypothetical protein [Nitrosophilus kaiyonis]
MRIENLIFLIGGELKNSPEISVINNFTFDVNLIKRGDLFFAKDKNEIEIAIKNGAYAIVFEGWTQITDQEIAWIKVDNLQNAALKLLRFLIIKEQIPLFLVTDIEFELAKNLLLNSEILFIEDDFIDSLINFYQNSPKLIFLKDKELLKRLALDIYNLNKTKEIKIINRYLFEISFVFNKKYFERVQISPIFIDELKKVLSIFEEFNILYSFKNLENFPHFKPYFVDKYLNQLEFGKSDRVIIVETNEKLLKREKEFLKNNAKWAKKIFISPKYIDNNFLVINEFDKIYEILYNLNYNFALIGIKDFKLKNFSQIKNQKTLF